MSLLDIHTHHLPVNGSQAILNCSPFGFLPQKDAWYSVGIHPWNISEDEQEWKRLQTVAHHSQVLAIGETGLDKLSSTDFKLQQIFFEEQIALAERVNKPLIIHSVRAANEIIRIKRAVHPSVPWIIHGFRGKKELAMQLTKEGIYLSFGDRYQSDSLSSIPLERLFIETDESTVPIHYLYEAAAHYCSLPYNQLLMQVKQNIEDVFFSR